MTLFSGTVRSNLDPGSQFSDREIWQALEKIGLGSMVREMESGIDSEVVGNGDNFSHGQKQELSLARAILLQPKILLLGRKRYSRLYWLCQYLNLIHLAKLPIHSGWVDLGLDENLVKFTLRLQALSENSGQGNRGKTQPMCSRARPYDMIHPIEPLTVSKLGKILNSL